MCEKERGNVFRWFSRISRIFNLLNLEKTQLIGLILNLEKHNLVLLNLEKHNLVLLNLEKHNLVLLNLEKHNLVLLNLEKHNS